MIESYKLIICSCKEIDYVSVKLLLYIKCSARASKWYALSLAVKLLFIKLSVGILMQVKQLVIDKVAIRAVTLFAAVALVGCTVAPTRHAPRHPPCPHYREKVVIYR
ncbi:hypothetical protein BGC07_00960 [Piscirickettsia litoralis]|uniref:Uncharacterized protein n=1 Tax=Piscirickettsia litoralis TaxID=1891921 RepID=A0ABX2ZYW6_9GAMM|nr:hypothetical protein BGC07_00960 [Piscirickettsia litoralis]